MCRAYYKGAVSLHAVVDLSQAQLIKAKFGLHHAVHLGHVFILWSKRINSRLNLRPIDSGAGLFTGMLALIIRHTRINKVKMRVILGCLRIAVSGRYQFD